MNWLEVSNYRKMGETGAEAIFGAVASAAKSGKSFRLGLATGNTMLGLYKRLAERFNEEKVPLSNLHTYNLDEYVDGDGCPLPDTHPLSYRKYMRENLFGRLDSELGFVEEHIHFPDPTSPEQFDQELAEAGGLDYQLLGIGFNGHIAFNEPRSLKDISAAAYAELPTRIVPLSQLTLDTNARLTADGNLAAMPTRAVSLGMKQILAAREIILLACFAEQQAPLQKMRSLKPTPELPASYLLEHPRVTIVYTADTIKLR